MAKRTAEEASLSTPATPQAEGATGQQSKKRKTDSSTIKQTKTTKKATAAPRKPRKPKESTPSVEAPQEAQPKRISKALANKINQIKEFRTDNVSSSNILTRSEGNPDHIIIPATALEGALIAMSADWAVERTYLESLLDAEGAVLKRFNRRWEYNEAFSKIPMVVLDLSKTTTLQKAIHVKIQGHGIEEVNLLEVELEMYEKQRAEFAGVQLLHATEQADEWTDDEEELPIEAKPVTPEQAIGSAKEEETVPVEKRADSPTEPQALGAVEDTKIQDQEFERIGVCPAPQKDL